MLRSTPASDAWSFGIVVIELLDDGNTSYHGMSNPDVMSLTMSVSFLSFCFLLFYIIHYTCYHVRRVASETTLMLKQAV
jgi:hypothetical protein